MEGIDLACQRKLREMERYLPQVQDMMDSLHRECNENSSDFHFLERFFHQLRWPEEHTINLKLLETAEQTFKKCVKIKSDNDNGARDIEVIGGRGPSRKPPNLNISGTAGSDQIPKVPTKAFGPLILKTKPKLLRQIPNPLNALMRPAGPYHYMPAPAPVPAPVPAPKMLELPEIPRGDIIAASRQKLFNNLHLATGSVAGPQSSSSGLCGPQSSPGTYPTRARSPSPRYYSKSRGRSPNKYSPIRSMSRSLSPRPRKRNTSRSPVRKSGGRTPLYSPIRSPSPRFKKRSGSRSPNYKSTGRSQYHPSRSRTPSPRRRSPRSPIAKYRPARSNSNWTKHQRSDRHVSSPHKGLTKESSRSSSRGRSRKSRSLSPRRRRDRSPAKSKSPISNKFLQLRREEEKSRAASTDSDKPAKTSSPAPKEKKSKKSKKRSKRKDSGRGSGEWSPFSSDSLSDPNEMGIQAFINPPAPDDFAIEPVFNIKVEIANRNVMNRLGPKSAVQVDAEEIDQDWRASMSETKLQELIESRLKDLSSMPDSPSTPDSSSWESAVDSAPPQKKGSEPSKEAEFASAVSEIDSVLKDHISLETGDNPEEGQEAKKTDQEQKFMDGRQIMFSKYKKELSETPVEAPKEPKNIKPPLEPVEELSPLPSSVPEKDSNKTTPQQAVIEKSSESSKMLESAKTKKEEASKDKKSSKTHEDKRSHNSSDTKKSESKEKHDKQKVKEPTDPKKQKEEKKDKTKKSEETNTTEKKSSTKDKEEKTELKPSSKESHHKTVEKVSKKHEVENKCSGKSMENSKSEKQTDSKVKAPKTPIESKTSEKKSQDAPKSSKVAENKLVTAAKLPNDKKPRVSFEDALGMREAIPKKIKKRPDGVHAKRPSSDASSQEDNVEDALNKIFEIHKKIAPVAVGSGILPNENVVSANVEVAVPMRSPPVWSTTMPKSSPTAAEVPVPAVPAPLSAPAVRPMGLSFRPRPRVAHQPRPALLPTPPVQPNYDSDLYTRRGQQQPMQQYQPVRAPLPRPQERPLPNYVPKTYAEYKAMKMKEQQAQKERLKNEENLKKMAQYDEAFRQEQERLKRFNEDLDRRMAARAELEKQAAKEKDEKDEQLATKDPRRMKMSEEKPMEEPGSNTVAEPIQAHITSYGTLVVPRVEDQNFRIPKKNAPSVENTSPSVASKKFGKNSNDPRPKAQASVEGSPKAVQLASKPKESSPVSQPGKLKPRAGILKNSSMKFSKKVPEVPVSVTNEPDDSCAPEIRPKEAKKKVYVMDSDDDEEKEEDDDRLIICEATPTKEDLTSDAELPSVADVVPGAVVNEGSAKITQEEKQEVAVVTDKPPLSEVEPETIAVPSAAVIEPIAEIAVVEKVPAPVAVPESVPAPVIPRAIAENIQLPGMDPELISVIVAEVIKNLAPTALAATVAQKVSPPPVPEVANKQVEEICQSLQRETESFGNPVEEAIPEQVVDSIISLESLADKSEMLQLTEADLFTLDKLAADDDSGSNQSSTTSISEAIAGNIQILEGEKDGGEATSAKEDVGVFVDNAPVEGNEENVTDNPLGEKGAETQLGTESEAIPAVSSDDVSIAKTVYEVPERVEEEKVSNQVDNTEEMPKSVGEAAEEITKSVAEVEKISKSIGEAAGVPLASRAEPGPSARDDEPLSNTEKDTEEPVAGNEEKAENPQNEMVEAAPPSDPDAGLTEAEKLLKSWKSAFSTEDGKKALMMLLPSVLPNIPIDQVFANQPAQAPVAAAAVDPASPVLPATPAASSDSESAMQPQEVSSSEISKKGGKRKRRATIIASDMTEATSDEERGTIPRVEEKMSGPRLTRRAAKEVAAALPSPIAPPKRSKKSQAKEFETSDDEPIARTTRSKLRESPVPRSSRPRDTKNKMAAASSRDASIETRPPPASPDDSSQSQSRDASVESQDSASVERAHVPSPDSPSKPGKRGRKKKKGRKGSRTAAVVAIEACTPPAPAPAKDTDHSPALGRKKTAELRKQDSDKSPPVAAAGRKKMAELTKQDADKSPPVAAAGKKRMGELDKLQADLSSAPVFSNLMNQSAHRACRTDKEERRDAPAPRARSPRVATESDTGGSDTPSIDLPDVRVQLKRVSPYSPRGRNVARRGGCHVARRGRSGTKTARRPEAPEAVQTPKPRESPPWLRRNLRKGMAAAEKKMSEANAETTNTARSFAVDWTKIDRLRMRRRIDHVMSPRLLKSERAPPVCRTQRPPRKQTRKKIREPTLITLKNQQRITLFELRRHAIRADGTGQPMKCLLCDAKAMDQLHLSRHYKEQHPESEVLISRMSPGAAKAAVAAPPPLLDADNEPVEAMKPRLRQQWQCRLCGKQVASGDDDALFVHISEHTGEYRWQCGAVGCDLTALTKESIGNHAMFKHSQKRPVERELFPTPTEYGHIYGYMCKVCHYVQTMVRNVEYHVTSHHSHLPNCHEMIIKIDMFEKPAIPAAAESEQEEPETPVAAVPAPRRITRSRAITPVTADVSAAETPPAEASMVEPSSESESTDEPAAKGPRRAVAKKHPSKAAVKSHKMKELEQKLRKYHMPQQKQQNQRPKQTNISIKLGPLKVTGLPNDTVIFECSYGKCIFTASNIGLFERHFDGNHRNVHWSNWCSTCSLAINERPKDKYPLQCGLRHLSHHIVNGVLSVQATEEEEEEEGKDEEEEKNQEEDGDIHPPLRQSLVKIEPMPLEPRVEVKTDPDAEPLESVVLEIEAGESTFTPLIHEEQSESVPETRRIRVRTLDELVPQPEPTAESSEPQEDGRDFVVKISEPYRLADLLKSTVPMQENAIRLATPGGDSYTRIISPTEAAETSGPVLAERPSPPAVAVPVVPSP